MQIIDYEKGHGNAGTFQIICRNCDSNYFSNYESENALLSGPTNMMLAEIALKNHLMVLSKRYHEVELYELLNTELSEIEGKEILDSIHAFDIRDEQFQFKRCKKIIDKQLKSGYSIIFYDLLDYVIPIAVQTPIALHHDLNYGIVNDIYNSSEDATMRDAHLAIFPLSEKTIILFFCHRDDRNYYKFHRQFQKLEHQMQLQMINYYIFKYSENYMLSPGIDRSIIKNKALQTLSREVGDIGDLGFIDPYKKKKAIAPDEIPNFLTLKK